MIEGLRLGDPAADAALLRCVLTVWPQAWRAAWRRIEVGGGRWLTTPDLTAHAEALAAQGVALEAVPDGQTIRADSLAEALPLRVGPEVAPDEALFLVPDAAAHATISRLLRLNHQAVEVARWDRDGEPLLALRVPHPPLYLLMRARDDADDPAAGGVRAYGRCGESPVFVAWGWVHPLAARLGAHVEGAVLIDPDGWRHADWPLEWSPLNAHLDAHLDAPRRDLQRTESPPPRFEVQLRLEEGQARLGTLWLLDPESFAELAPLIESSSPAALRSVRVSRLADGHGVRYLLRAQGSDDAVMSRVGDLIGQPGFAHVPGANRIFVPAGMRLMPQMGLDALRPLLDPPDDGVVLVEATRDGPSVLRISAPEAVPLADWVDYVTMDNRAVLDAILEEAVFAMPTLNFDRPLRATRRRPPPRKRARKRPPKLRIERPGASETQGEEGVDPDMQALQAEAAALQERVVEGGLTDAGVLGRMGELLGRLGVPGDAAWCFEAAAFHAPTADARRRWMTALLDIRSAQAGVDPAQLDEAMIEAATVTLPTPVQLGLLGAASAARLLQDEALIDGLRAPLIKVFAEPGAPCTRRLAWMTLFETAAATSDALGATRAKEAVFGAMNSAGLRDAFDAPAFVRLSLALATDDAGGQSDAQAVQGASLETIWTQFEAGHAELEAQALLYKSVFAVGFARLGNATRARQLATIIEEERPAHDAPTGALARLYLARLATRGGEDADATWQIAADEIIAGLSAQHQRAVRFARRRSAWLTDEQPPPPGALRPHIRAILARAPDDPAKALSLITQLSDAWDVEIARAVRGQLNAALATGKDALIEATIQVAARAIETLEIRTHQVCALGDVLRAQALIDSDDVDDTLRSLAQTIHKVDGLSTILPTVRIALSTLRRVDAGPRAEHFLSTLARVIERGTREAARLGAFVADGHRLLGDATAAHRALDATLAAIFDPDLDNGSRFEGVATLFDLLRAWPSEVRESVARQVLQAVDRFRDGFTTRRYFELFKVLCVERAVDALIDTHSLSTGRIRAWLEREEQTIRRQILTDWRRLR